MTAVTYPDRIAIWELIYYSVSLPAAVWVTIRQGFGRSSGWIFLATFSIIRIIHSSAQLATIHSKSSAAITTAEITGFLWVVRTVAVFFGNLVASVSPSVPGTEQTIEADRNFGRWYSILKSPWNILFSFVILRAVQTPAAVGFILGIVGATSADSIDTVEKQTTIRVGVVLYLVVLVTIVVLAVGAASGRRSTHRGEVQLLAAVGLSLPILLVRIVYSLLGCFLPSKSSTLSLGLRLSSSSWPPVRR